MAEDDEMLQRVKQLVDAAEGFVDDAEFLEEIETRLLRYLQAMTNILTAISIQNDVVIKMLKSQTEMGGLSGG